MGMFDKYNDSVMFNNPCPPGCETCCPLDIQLAYDPITNVLTLTYIYDSATVVRTVNLTDLQEPLTISLSFNPTTNIITLAGTYANVPFSNTIDITHSHDLELIINGTFLELTGEHDGEQVLTSVDLSPIIFSATGPAGPQGPAGNNGATGPQGIPGPVGPAGLNWQGEWSALGTYVLDDAVAYNGASYFCINPVGPSATTPDIDITNWALLAAQGATGPQGPQGATGPQGSTGPQGPIGLTGPQGPAGTGGGFTHYLGEAFGGGIIYYLYIGSDGLEHGLIVSLTESVSLAWQTVSTITNGRRSEDGAYNTALMTGSPAATYIASLGAGWYLPSIDELVLLYNNRYSAQKGLRAGGNTLISSATVYWSSTEFNNANAYIFNFTAGAGNVDFKTLTCTVRGIKAF